MISPIPGAELFSLTRRITGNVAFYLPRNVDIAEVGGLVSRTGSESASEHLGAVGGEQGRMGGGGGGGGQREGMEGMEKVEIEEEWMGHKLKAVTAYFGGLVSGQEDRF